MTDPVCSVIIPAYNCEKYLKAAVESVLKQTFKEWEMIIVNDCSTDGTSQIAEELESSDSRVHFFRNERNMGAARTRNRGIGLAKGKYIALLDSDDLWLPQKLEYQIAVMEEHNCPLSYTSYELIDEKSEKIGITYNVPSKICFKDLLKQNVIGCSTVMVKRDFMLEHPMNHEFYHEDYVTWLDMLKDGETACGISRVLVQYRAMSGTRSRNKLQASRHVWNIYRKYLKYNLLTSCALFSAYAVNGLKKYKLEALKK